jgi:hypothetical protein
MKTAEKLLREKYNLKGDRGELRIDQLVVIMNDFGKQLLEEYTNRIVENGKCLHTGYGGYTINKKSITSQLPKFLKEKGI